MTFDFFKEALIASGVKNEDLILYDIKLDYLYKKFIKEADYPSESWSMAKALFSYLWLKKPNRYKPHGNWKLNEVIDAQLSEESIAVGNCLGLTILYNSLLKKMGLDPFALYLDNAFGIGPHVLTIIEIDNNSIYVENIFPNGFDYKGHSLECNGTRWAERELIADIYLSLGNENFEKGNYIKSMEAYEKAIEFNPNYEKAKINRAILLDKLKFCEEKGIL